jgi:hypothetical protein
MNQANSAMQDDLPEPYRRLLRAVLTAATKDYYSWHNRYFDGCGSAHRRNRNTAISDEALAWFLPNEDEAETGWPFSFHGICRAVGLNEKAILNEILANESNGVSDEGR